MPGYVGVAVKTTVCPTQEGLAEAAILMATASTEYAVMVIAFEMAGLPDAQFRLEVS